MQLVEKRMFKAKHSSWQMSVGRLALFATLIWVAAPGLPLHAQFDDVEGGAEAGAEPEPGRTTGGSGGGRTIRRCR